MPRRRRKENADMHSANTSASSPNHERMKKQRKDDEQSVLDTILSSNRYSTAGTAVNDSDLDGFGDEEPVPSTSKGSTSLEVKTKMPPLVVKQVPLDKLVGIITSIGVTAEYKLTRFGIKAMLRNKNDYTRVCSLLKDSKLEFFTHDIPGEKPYKVVIRGLPNVDPSTIAAELKDRYKLIPIAVHRIVRKDAATKLYPDTLFLVHFKRGTVTLNALQAIHSLFHIIIRWEKYRGGRRDVTQCQRCLNYGHGTRNCFVSPRCTNCALNHASAECPMAGAMAEGAMAFKCANCGGPHQGSDRKCPKRDDFKRIRKLASTTNQPGRKVPAPNLRPEDFPPLPSSRSRVAPAPPPPPSANPWHRQQSPPAAATQSKSTGKAGDETLLTDEELVMLVADVLTIKRSCSTRAEQLQAVVSLIAKYGD